MEGGATEWQVQTQTCAVAGPDCIDHPGAGLLAVMQRASAPRRRQPQCKLGPALGMVAGQELAAVALHYAVADGQAQPCALAHGLGGEKGLEHVRQHLGRNARPGVLDAQHGAALRPAKSQINPPALRRVANRVDNQIAEGAPQEGIITLKELKENGGYQFPPLWGPNSYNWGAGMHRVNTAAGFIKANMPFGRGGTLTDQQAWDVAAFVNSRPRPQDPRFTGDVAETRAKFHNDDDFYGVTLDGKVVGAEK